MSRKFCRIIVWALTLVLVGGVALAEVRATGNIWMRTGPGLSYDQISSYPEGYSFRYEGETSVDERGVAWYKVSTEKHTGWVSSRYSELRGEDAAPAPGPTSTPTPAPTASLPDGSGGWLDLNPQATPADQDSWVSFDGTFPGGSAAQASSDAGTAMELSDFYQEDLVSSANDIGLISYREVQSEVPYQYYNDAMILAGNQTVENIVVYGAGYAVFGVTIGMPEASAKECLNAAGLDYLSGLNGIVYEHRAQENSGFVDENGHDSCINLWIQNGLVTEIDWSSYTG